MNTDSFLNPDFMAGRATSTCCSVCVKQASCPFEVRRCRKDHVGCSGCDHWDTRGCIFFQFDKKFLKMSRES